MTSPFVLANQATEGFKDAGKYDTHRPSYPSEAVSKLLSHLNVAEQLNAKVVEVGAGTGKLTELLAARREEFEIVAVDPHNEMREGLVQKALPRVKIIAGDAAKMPIEEGWGDACIAAQAWHWFSNEESLREINRVLRPGATFGMIWNVEDYNAPTSWQCTTNWEQKLKDIILTLGDGHPRFRDLKWKDVFEAQLDTTPLQTLTDTFTHNLPKFSLPLGEEDVKWTVWLTEQSLWDRYSTLSQIANLKGEEAVKVKNEALAALKGDDVEKNEKGEIAVHGKTYYCWTSRI